VELNNDIESRAVPGLKVVQTPLLDEYADYDRFWESFITVLKTHYKEDQNVKGGEFRQILDNKFDIVIVYDGAAQGLQGDFAHRVIYTLDKAKGEICEELRDNARDILLYCGMFKVLRDPLQLEYSRQLVIPQPRSGPLVVGVLKSVLAEILGREVDVKPDQSATKLPGFRAAMSEDLAKDTTFEQLWDGMMKLFKEQRINAYKVGEPEVEVEMDDDSYHVFNVTCTVDGQKMLDDKVIPSLPPGGGNMTATYHVRGSHLERCFSYQEQYAGMLLDIHNVFIIPEPLHVEIFSVLASPPQAGDEAKDMASKLVNLALQKIQDS